MVGLLQLYMYPDLFPLPKTTSIKGGSTPDISVRLSGYLLGNTVPAARKVSAAMQIVFNDAKAPASLALILAVIRFGMAIAAMTTIMATTIRISTNVKPLFLQLFINNQFLVSLPFSWCFWCASTPALRSRATSLIYVAFWATKTAAFVCGTLRAKTATLICRGLRT